MTGSETKIVLSEGEFAHLGAGSVAYLRKMKSEELKNCFPDLPKIAAGVELWALFAANGQPIMLADEREGALAGAMQNDLTPVSIH